MPSDTTRKTVALPDSLWLQVEAFRNEESIGTTTEAVRQLVKEALRMRERSAAE